AQKAQIERLAAEFANELESLGVRVGKLEKKLDNVTITGEVRFSNYTYDKLFANKENLRSRIFINGQVNDRWKYTGMFENTQNLRFNDSEGGVNLRRAWVTGSIGDVGVRLGRFPFKVAYGAIVDNEADGIDLTYKKGNFDVGLFAVRPETSSLWLGSVATIVNNAITTIGSPAAQKVQVLGGQVGYKFNKNLDLRVAYFDIKGKGDYAVMDIDDSSLEVILGYKFSKELSAYAEYIRAGRKAEYTLPQSLGGGTYRDSKTGWAAGVVYSTLSRAKANTYAVRANYYDIPTGALIDHTSELDFGVGFKGYSIGASYMLAKNVELAVDYFDFEGRKNLHNLEEDLLWTKLFFYF
ncbi:MAG: porin, partial [Acidaminococcales bacterium]|nr:porin [Acidaminococcales bacterium]